MQRPARMCPCPTKIRVREARCSTFMLLLCCGQCAILGSFIPADITEAQLTALITTTTVLTGTSKSVVQGRRSFKRVYSSKGVTVRVDEKSPNELSSLVAALNGLQRPVADRTSSCPAFLFHTESVSMKLYRASGAVIVVSDAQVACRNYVRIESYPNLEYSTALTKFLVGAFGPQNLARAKGGNGTVS